MTEPGGIEAFRIIPADAGSTAMYAHPVGHS